MAVSDNLKVNSKIVFREECSGALLFDPDTGSIKVLNETGKFIWQNLTVNSSKELLLEKIMDNFDLVDRNKIEEDLEKFLEELQKLKLLEINEGKTSQRNLCS